MVTGRHSQAWRREQPAWRGGVGAGGAAQVLERGREKPLCLSLRPGRGAFDAVERQSLEVPPGAGCGDRRVTPVGRGQPTRFSHRSSTTSTKVPVVRVDTHRHDVDRVCAVGAAQFWHG